MKAGGKKRSENDPELASGFGVFVNEDQYQETLRKNANVAEVRDMCHMVRSVLSLLTQQVNAPTCGTDFHAVADAKSRAGADTVQSGRKVTGVAGMKCARHAFVERVADLQKGERSVYSIQRPDKD
jgi:hypothetical protein